MLIENKFTEFKREYVESIKNTVIAFANTDGGKIYIGIDDDGGSFGVADIDGTMLRITNAIRDSVRPDITLFTDCSVFEIEGRDVIVVDVLRGTARPYYLAGKGIRPEGVFVRQGASTVPATDTAILNMIKETSGDCYEDARSIVQQLTFEKAEAYFNERGLEFGDTQKRTLNVVGTDGTYTNLALLLSEQCPHTIKLAVFEGGRKSVFKDRRELCGSLLAQMEETYSYIDRYNRVRSEFEGLSRIDMRDYPPEAVREALLNAIVHRDYSFSGSTLVSIFDDRIEFVSIGGLVRGISFNDIMLGVSVPRNKRLADVFYRLKLIEAYGTGIMKINECYEDLPVKPRVDVSDNAFKITLPNANYSGADAAFNGRVSSPRYGLATRADGREDIIVRLLAEQPYIVRGDVERALAVSQATAILLLREMTKRGRLVKEGSGKYVRYRLPARGFQ